MGCQISVSVKSNNSGPQDEHFMSWMFLPPSPEWGLGEKACALLHMAQNAPRRLSSCGSRCPGHCRELLTLAVQSPEERSDPPGGERCSGVGTTKCPAVKNHRRKAEGTPGPLPGPMKAQDPHRTHTRRLGCQNDKGQTLHHRHL